MRKFLLSVFGIFIFVAYAIHQHTDVETANVVALKNLVGKNINSTSDKPAGSSPDPTPTTEPSSGSNLNSSVMHGNQKMAGYKNGQYTGNSVDAYYGYIQVRATVSSGKIVDVVFLDYPQDRRTSIQINSQAMPYLKQEALLSQSAHVDIVSGATDSSNAFIESLGSALDKAK